MLSEAVTTAPIVGLPSLEQRGGVLEAFLEELLQPASEPIENVPKFPRVLADLLEASGVPQQVLSEIDQVLPGDPSEVVAEQLLQIHQHQEEILLSLHVAVEFVVRALDEHLDLRLLDDAVRSLLFRA